MEHLEGGKTMDANTLMCGQLALDRCRNYVNHIHAILFLCGQHDAALDEKAINHIHRIASLLGEELETGFQMLMPEAADGDQSNVIEFSAYI